MGKEWDSFGTDLQKYQEWTRRWASEVLRVLKPGGYLLAFGGTRTYHRMVCGIEDAGFEIRDCIIWLYSSGFPKSLNIAKSIDRLLKEGKASLNSIGDNSKGALYFHKLNFEQGYRPKDYTNVERRKYEITEDIAKKWEGWGTALKPAYEPIVVARKPLSERNVALNVLKWGTGGINIDACRVGQEKVVIHHAPAGTFAGGEPDRGSIKNYYTSQGRFPANVILECICDEVIERKEEKKPYSYSYKGKTYQVEGFIKNIQPQAPSNYNDIKSGVIHTNPQCVCYMLDKQSGINASRFFYCAKASRKERDMGLENLPLKKGGGMKGTEDQSLLTGSGNVRNNLIRNNHPTVKPLRLLEYLVKLVTPPGGLVLDPFAGSGTTCIACKKLGFRFIGIEKEAEYVEIARARLRAVKEDKQLGLF